MNNKYKIIIGMTFLLLMLGFTSAIVDVDYIAKQSTSVDIFETCTAQGFACDSDYECNITIINPDLDIGVREGIMTRDPPTYNYTFTDTNILGLYNIHIYCSDGTNSGHSDLVLQVTTTGRPPEIKLAIFLLIISFVVLILALYFKNNALGFISGVLFLITGIYLIAYGFGDIADMYTQAMGYVIIAFGLFTTLIAGYEWLQSID